VGSEAVTGEREEREHLQMEAVLLRAADVLDKVGIDYAVMGGLASAAVGRLRHTHDVDLFVSHRGAVSGLAALDQAGFRTERTDEEWLYKAFWGDVMVDLIFESTGGITFDEEMRRRRRPIDVRDRELPAIPPEDLVVIKALAHKEHTPRHWFDALAVIEAGDLDYEYLARRARVNPGRVASLLLYARASGCDVPEEQLRELLAAAGLL